MHAEACTHLHRTIQYIHSKGIKAGIAMNPATPLCIAEPHAGRGRDDSADERKPGFGGQAYIPLVTDKIRELRAMCDARGLEGYGDRSGRWD